MPQIVYLTSDLMFSSRVAGAATALGLKLDLVPNQAALLSRLAEDCRLVLIDLTLDRLDLPGAVAAVRSAAPQAATVAYGPHVDVATLAAAKDAGCTHVLSRGQFHQQFSSLLQQVALSA